MKFTKGMTLKYDVYCGSKCVLPAGTPDVKIAFRQSHLRRYDKCAKRFVPMNVYMHKGAVYHV
jgi:hypothetical protein